MVLSGRVAWMDYERKIFALLDAIPEDLCKKITVEKVQNMEPFFDSLILRKDAQINEYFNRIVTIKSPLLLNNATALNIAPKCRQWYFPDREAQIDYNSLMWNDFTGLWVAYGVLNGISIVSFVVERWMRQHHSSCTETGKGVKPKAKEILQLQTADWDEELVIELMHSLSGREFSLSVRVEMEE